MRPVLRRPSFVAGVTLPPSTGTSYNAAPRIEGRDDLPVVAPTPAPAGRRVAERDRLPSSEAEFLELAGREEADPLPIG